MLISTDERNLDPGFIIHKQTSTDRSMCAETIAAVEHHRCETVL